MVSFAERIEGRHKYLQIFTDSSEVPTELLVFDPLVKGVASPLACCSTYSRENLTERIFFGKGDTHVRHLLRARNNPSAIQETPTPLLKDRIDSGEAQWSDQLELLGEFQYTAGYWEWTENVLQRCATTLADANILEAVQASLYTYDRMSDMARAFCLSWSPSTNTLVTTVGELSISLWDLHRLGGLPILGDLFDEVTPSADELNGHTPDMQPYLPTTCKHLLHAFHLICEKKDDHLVSISDWIKFWSNVPFRYPPPPSRSEQPRSKRQIRTYNPIGILPRVEEWSNLSFKWPEDELQILDSLLNDSEKINYTQKAPTKACTGASISGEAERAPDMYREFTIHAWKILCARLNSNTIEHVLSIQGELENAFADMKKISKVSLTTLEDGLQIFFRNVRLFHETRLRHSELLPEDTYSQVLSSTTDRYEGAKSQLEEKEKHLAALEQQQEVIRTKIRQEKEAVKALQSDVSTLGDELTSLKNSVPLSKEEENRLQQMKMSLEAQKTELGKLEF